MPEYAYVTYELGKGLGYAAYSGYAGAEEERSPTDFIKEGFHHSSFLSGGQVCAAGEIRAKKGVLELISNCSGHYQPGEDFIRQPFLELEDRGFDFSKGKYALELAIHGSDKSQTKPIDAKVLAGWRKDVFTKKNKPVNDPGVKKVLDKYKGEGEKSVTVGAKVRYLKPEELKKTEVEYDKAKKLLLVDGKPLDTYGGLIYGFVCMKDRFIFVMTKTGEIYAADVIKNMKWLEGPSVEAHKKKAFEVALFEREKG